MAAVSGITLRLQLPAHFLDDRGRRAGFVLLVAFLVSFLFIRTSARLIRSPRFTWWPGSVKTAGGLHLHHLVWGIGLLLISGFLGFAVDPRDPGNEILAALFGVGAGLTLDEFALWVYLRDVYWSEEGRTSFDAVVVAAMIGGMIILGLVPFDLHRASSIDTLLTAVAVDLMLAVLVILKGKPVLGLVGVFLPLVSVVGLLRLASPGSPWARRLYRPDGHRLARSEKRWERIRTRRRRVGDLIAGSPSLPAQVAPVISTGEPAVSTEEQPTPSGTD